MCSSDLTQFLGDSIGGGAITAYDAIGNAVNINLRWTKTASSVYGGTDTWNLFYETDSNATAGNPAWINAGTDQSNDGGTDDPSSFHVRGAHHLFGDGSVRFLRNISGDKNDKTNNTLTSDRLAFWALGTKADSDSTAVLE